MLKVKLNFFYVFSLLILSFASVFSMQNEIQIGVLYSGNYSDCDHRETYDRFVSSLPESAKSQITANNCILFPKAAINNPNTHLSFGIAENECRLEARILSANEDSLEINGRLIVDLGLDSICLEPCSRRINLLSEQSSLPEDSTKIIIPNEQGDLDVYSPPVDPVYIDNHRNSTDSYGHQADFDRAKSLAYARPRNTHTYIDLQNKNRDLNITINNIDITKKFATQAYNSNSISDLETAISRVKWMLDDVNQERIEYGYNMRGAIRSEFKNGYMSSLDNAFFQNESSAKKKGAKFLGFFGSPGRAVGRFFGGVYDLVAANSKDKFAIREGLGHDLELLKNKLREVMEDSHITNIQRTDDEVIFLDREKVFLPVSFCDSLSQDTIEDFVEKNQESNDMTPVFLDRKVQSNELIVQEQVSELPVQTNDFATDDSVTNDLPIDNVEIVQKINEESIGKRASSGRNKRGNQKQSTRRPSSDQNRAKRTKRSSRRNRTSSQKNVVTEASNLKNEIQSNELISQKQISEPSIQRVNISQEVVPRGGFFSRTADKIRDFVKSPEGLQAIDNSLQAGIRNVLLDDSIDESIKEAVDNIAEIFSESNVSSDFEKRHIDPYKEQSIEYFQTPLSQDRVEFKNLVENKILLTKARLASFYDECNNVYINSNRDPLGADSNEYSKKVCLVASHGLNLANEYNHSNNIEMANDITDFSSALIDVAKGTKEFFKLVGTGALQGIEKYKDPVQVVKDFGEGFINLGISLAKITLNFAEFNYTCIRDPEMATKIAQSFFSDTAEKLKRMERAFSSLPYEKRVILISQILTDGIIDTAIFGGASKLGSKTTQFFKAITNLVEKEVTIAKLAARLSRNKVVNFKEAWTPLTNAVMETSELVQIAGTNGIKLSKASFEIVSKNKGLIVSEGSISKVVSKVIKKTNKAKTGFVNLASEGKTHHIIIGEKISTNKFSGGHKFPGNPGKTVFPQSWSKEKIMHEISDIATDPNLQWIPQTGNGGSFTRSGRPAKFLVEGVRDSVKIRVVVEPAGEDIITGFALNGPRVTCRVRNI